MKQLTYIPLYLSYLDAIETLADAERGRLLTCLLEYANGDKEAEKKLSGGERHIWPIMRGQYDRDMDKYINVCKTNSDNAKKRYEGMPSQATACERKRKPAKAAKKKEKEKKKENEKLSTNVDSKSTRFARPSLYDVRDYIYSINANVDAQNFIDFYTANGWKVGKNPMKDWKAAVRTWARRSNNNAGGKSNPFDGTL